MGRKRLLLHTISILSLTAPNMIYLLCNYSILKEANAISLSMVAILTLSIVGVGTLAHLKIKGGIWALMIGLFVLALSNIAYVAGMALIIEGAGISLDGYLLKPMIEKSKIKEFEKKGGNITYTKEFK